MERADRVEERKVNKKVVILSEHRMVLDVGGSGETGKNGQK